MALTDQKNVHGENVKRHAAPRAKHVEGCARPTDTDGIRRLRPTPLTRLNTLRGGHPNPPPTPISRRLPLAKQPRLERAAYSLSTHTPISSYAKKKKKTRDYRVLTVCGCRLSTTTSSKSAFDIGSFFLFKPHTARSHL